MDADLYSSTIFVLTQLVPFLNKDDIIIFDEFGVPMHEFRAFQDFFNSFYMKFELLSATNNYLQIAIKLVSNKFVTFKRYFKTKSILSTLNFCLKFLY